MTQTTTLLEMLQDEKYQALGIKLNPPASYREVESFEKVLERQLPQDLRAFYLSVNGFETDDDMFRVIPIHEVIEYKLHQRSARVNFAEYMIYCDTWNLSLDANSRDRYSIVNRDTDKDSDVVLTNSIYEFLERYLVNGGMREEFGLISWNDRLKSKRNQA